MGAFYDEIPTSLIPWIKKQKVFFVGTAPLKDGRVNISPKELEGTFEVVDERRVWYQDLTGSGIETIAHINEPGNGRLTIMFVAFEGPPRIVRLFGKGRSYERTTEGFKKYLPDGDARIKPGARAVVELAIEKVGTSCGYSIPYFDYLKPREQLDSHNQKKQDLDLLYPGAQLDDADLLERPVTPGGLRDYWAKKNAASVHNGLPGLEVLVAGGQAGEGDKDDGSSGIRSRRPASKRTLEKKEPDTKTKGKAGKEEFVPPAWANMAIRAKPPPRSSFDDLKLVLSCTLLGLVAGMAVGDYWKDFVAWSAPPSWG